MINNKNTTLLRKQHLKQVLFLYASICFSFMAFLLWLYIPYAIQPFNHLFFLLAFLGIVVLAAIPFLYEDFRLKQSKYLLKHINAHPKMEYSTTLLVKNSDNLNSLEKIQLSKIQTRVSKVFNELNTPHFFGKAFICVFINLLLVGWVIQFQLDTQAVKSPVSNILPNAKSSLEFGIADSTQVVSLKDYKIKVIPPKYTRLQSFAQKEMDIEIAEGSLIEWRLQFDRNAPKPIVEIDGKSIPFRTNDSVNYAIELTLKTPRKTWYNLKADTTIKAPILNTLYAINVIPDKKPIVRITNLKHYQQIRESELKPQMIRYILKDDYGISKADIQLLKSSGDGESVIFEEENYALSTVRKEEEQSLTINLNDLKPEPGDEFYIRIEASDNHPAKKQTVFSDTYIIAIEDTTKQQADFTMALGMDREPEYFRSQRQLIIDTENLIEQKTDLSELTFKEESNNIGIEQKLLRLRYGKFLGEEFEGTIGIRTSYNHASRTPNKKVSNNTVSEKTHHQHEESLEHHHDHDHHEEEHHHEHDHHKEEHQTHKKHDHNHHENCDHNHEHDMLEEVEHFDEKEHGHENELLAHDHSSHDDDHDHSSHNYHHHGEETENPEAPKNWLAPFQHFHDNAESNTFFESEVKAKLKAALAQMWDAELQLRLGQPALSLPYQHKALKLIKEVQQASRVYVERVGLDLPEIDVAKKRLRGELDEITDPKHIISLPADQVVQKIYLALQKVEYLIHQQTYTFETHQTVNKIKDLLYGIREKDENCYVQCLHILNQIPNKINKLHELQYVLHLFLKENESLSGKTVRKNSRLENLYWQYVN